MLRCKYYGIISTCYIAVFHTGMNVKCRMYDLPLCFLSLSARVKVGIINGTEAKPHSRPYMVSVQKDGQHHCGGFLVSDQYVMSAAHCWEENEKFTAVLGAHDLSNSNENAINMAVEPKIHENYHRENYDWDIMFWKLPEAVKKSKTVSWISIPESNEEIPGDTVCSVAGWGKTESKTSSVRLLETETTVMDRTKCEQIYLQLTSRMMCAMHPGKPCQGDSGGPLVCNDVAVGIVSFGRNPCESSILPEVYVKIGAYLPWIKKIIGKV
uniref:Si:dkey-78l4.8 n=1 Tax=Astyanax mexicanus TaxID=7994 RepID=A0A3B1JPI1_ASTMX